jgi:hypothetical protein
MPPWSSKRQKELQRKKRLDEKRSRLATRREAKSGGGGTAVEGPVCGFCSGSLADPDSGEVSDLSYGGHPICQSCYDSLPRTDDA